MPASQTVELIAFVVVVLIVYFGILAVIVFSSDRERWSVAGVFVASAAGAGLVFALPHGFDDPDANWGTRAIVATALGLGTGALAYVLRRTAPVRLITAGLVAVPFVPGGLFLFLLGILGFTDACLD